MNKFYRQEEAQNLATKLEDALTANGIFTSMNLTQYGTIQSLLIRERDLKGRNDTLLKEKEGLKGRNITQITTIQVLQKREKELKCQVTALKRCNGEYLQKHYDAIKQLKQEVYDLKATDNGKSVTIMKRNVEIKELKLEIARLNQETAILYKECEKLDDDKFAYFQSCQELEATVERCKASNLWQCNDDQLKTIQEQNETIKILEAHAAQGNNCLRECNANQAKMLGERNIEIEDLALDNKELRAANTGLGMQLSNQKGTIIIRNEQIAELEQQLQAAKTEKQHAYDCWRDAACWSSSNLKEKETRIRELEDQLKKRKNQLYMVAYGNNAAQSGMVKEVVDRVLKELRENAS